MWTYFFTFVWSQALWEFTSPDSGSRKHFPKISITWWGFLPFLFHYPLHRGVSATNWMQFIYLIGNVIIMLVCVLPIIVCAVTYLLTWKAPHDLNQAIDRKPGVLVLTVAMFTLIILYMPFFLTVCTDLPFMLDSLASLRLISDPLLCVLVCRELGSSVPRTHRSITIN